MGKDRSPKQATKWYPIGRNKAKADDKYLDGWNSRRRAKESWRRKITEQF